jgi:hypothetical protein
VWLPENIEPIEIKVTNAARLIAYTCRGAAWAVWDPITRNAYGDFEI